MTPDPVPTHRELLARMRRLAQLADLSCKRALRHGEACPACRAERPCIEGATGRMQAVTLVSCVATLHGEMSWR
jgi:hypothetical protein